MLSLGMGSNVSMVVIWSQISR